MEQEYSQTEIFAKAKIEEPNVRLPKMLNPDGDPVDDLLFMKIFYDTQKDEQVAEKDISEVKLDRKVYRIRNKELVKVLGDDYEAMKEIQKVSKAKIGILADVESNLHGHSYLDLSGSVEEVKAAEELILDKVLKTYSSMIFPIILMPPTIYGDHLIIPVHKVVGVLGTSGSNLLWIEMESGTWIKIEPGPSPGGGEWDRTVKIFGPRENVEKAISLILAVISKPGELSAAEALNELLHQLKEPSCAELNGAGKDTDHGESRFKQSVIDSVKEKQKINDEEAHKKPLLELISRKNPLLEKLKNKQTESDSEEDKKQKAKAARWRRRILRKKSINRGSEKEMTQQEFKERRIGVTVIRNKERGDKYSEKKQQQNEFKIPRWSQTFGYMITGGGESSELEKGKQKVMEDEEDEKDADDESEVEMDVDEEDEKEKEKGKMVVDVEDV